MYVLIKYGVLIARGFWSKLSSLSSIPGNSVIKKFSSFLSFSRKEGLLPLEEVIKDYIRLAVDCDNNTSNTKYCVAQMLQSAMEGKEGRALLAAANMREIW